MLDLSTEMISQDLLNQRFADVVRELKTTARVKSQGAVAEAIGVKANHLSRVVNRDAAEAKNATPEMTARLLQSYPDVNPSYLLGISDGPIFLEGNALGLGPMVDQDYVDLPFVRADMRAGFTDSIVNNEPIEIETLRVLYVQPKLYSKGVIFEVNGDSMEPYYLPGARVLALPVEPGDWEFLNSGVYAVAFGNSFVIKRIKDNELVSKGYLTLHSDNPQGGSLPVALKHIRAIWKIEQTVYSPAR